MNVSINLANEHTTQINPMPNTKIYSIYLFLISKTRFNIGEKAIITIYAATNHILLLSKGNNESIKSSSVHPFNMYIAKVTGTVNKKENAEERFLGRFLLHWCMPVFIFLYW